MDTDGHEECATQAGIPLLQNAMQRVSKTDWRLQAFYLGNWLTDVSQVIDPVGAAKFSTTIKSVIDRLFSELLSWSHLLPPGLENLVSEPLEEYLSSYRRTLTMALEALAGDREAVYATAVRKLFFVIGYFKFVHPETRGARARMPFQSYVNVFREQFTQYYPHEHLDRYPKDLSAHGAYTSRRARRQRTPISNRGLAYVRPHLYEYELDAIEICSGLLAEIDSHWATLTFDAQEKWAGGDSNNNWNLWLARLGHALHLIEDFFAHSTFIELALENLDQPQRGDFTPFAERIYHRRLRRFKGAGIDSREREDYVVTGYFDVVDTFFSMRHAYRELFGEKDADRFDTEELVNAVRKTLRAIVGEMKLVLGQSQLSPQEARAAAANMLLRQVASDDADVKAAAHMLLSEVPYEIKASFLDAVVLTSRTPGVALTLYDALETLDRWADYISTPAEWVEDIIAALPRALRRVARSIVSDLTTFVERQIDELLGRYRIGSHSLMAKDYRVGELGIDQMHSASLTCAKVVHWYVIHSLTRWTDEKSKDWIDWLELLEYSLRNPSTIPPEAQWWGEAIRLSIGPPTSTDIPALGAALAAAHSPVTVSRTEVARLSARGRNLRSEAERRYRP